MCMVLESRLLIPEVPLWLIGLDPNFVCVRVYMFLCVRVCVYVRPLVWCVRVSVDWLSRWNGRKRALEAI